jgi:DNA-binding NarL/FixJ family response regulator
VAVVAITPDEAQALLAGRDVVPSLTPEEEQVLSLLLKGHTVTAIGRSLGVSPRSVQRRLARLRATFDVPSNNELVVAAARAGFT